MNPALSLEAVASEPTIRVVLVDDHPVVRHGLKAVLESEPDLRVCGQAGSISEAIRTIEQTRPDVVFVDLNLKGESGFDLLTHIRSHWVGLKAVVVTQHASKALAEKARSLGAVGYVCKDHALEQVADVARSVNEGYHRFALPLSNEDGTSG
jgi:DNA-binding NarL/FixJ family response regulator